MDLVESKARLSRVTLLPNVAPLEQEWAPDDAPTSVGRGEELPRAHGWVPQGRGPQGSVTRV
eukprot:scaffold7_cov414-Pavlova_lutheri.AAC.10